MLFVADAGIFFAFNCFLYSFNDDPVVSAAVVGVLLVVVMTDEDDDEDDIGDDKPTEDDLFNLFVDLVSFDLVI